MESGDSQLLFNQYLDLYEKHSKQYGKIALLMQVGSFYEMYTTLDGTRGNAKEVADALEMECNAKKDNRSRMAGFPVHAFGKHLPRLIKEGYTVVCYDQEGNVKDPSIKKVKRSLVRVVSPGTDLDNMEVVSSWIVSIFLQFYPHPFKRGTILCSLGLAATDRTVSQKVIVLDVHDTHQDTCAAMDKMTAFLKRYNPTECIVTSSNLSCAEKWMNKALNSHDTMVHYYAWDATQPSQHTIDTLSFHENEAYTALFTFLQDHFLTMSSPVIEQFQNPMFLELSGTASEQLDVQLLLKTINKTRTKMGYRLFKERLYLPITDMNEINARLDAVDKMTINDMTGVREALSGIPDVCRLHQLWNLQRIKPNQVKACIDTYERVINILDKLYPLENKLLVSSYLNACKQPFDLSKLDTDDLTNNIFTQEYDKDLSNLLAKAASCEEYVQEMKQDLEKTIEKPDAIKMNWTQRGFETTQLRAKTIKTKYPDLIYRNTKNAVIISSNELSNVLDDMDTIKRDIELKQNDLFREFLISTTQEYHDIQQEIEQYLANVDVVSTSKYIAHVYRYTRPNVIMTGQRRIILDQLRHPIIERLHDHQKYIPCDIHMDEQGTIGHVMYGMNAGGKTSILKAVGLAVVMAQAGMYVPAAHCVLTPFKQIMTRIAGGDNIIRSQSSFQVEMEEIRSVLQRAQEDTLLLGDEVCRGTEVNSANAIVYTLFKHLNDQGIFFLAATHLHDIASHIQQHLLRVRVCHTQVDILPDGEIVYKRTLADGAGPPMYGLEVARALDFPQSFLINAKQFRDDAIQSVPKRSRYNVKKLVKKCQVCNKKPNKNGVPLDTHHMNFQCNADDDGYHDHNYQHALHNLVILCKQHHEQVHTGDLILEMLQTPKGAKLKYSWQSKSRPPEEDLGEKYDLEAFSVN